MIDEKTSEIQNNRKYAPLKISLQFFATGFFYVSLASGAIFIMWIEQTEIARKKLGISMKALHKILKSANYDTPENYRLLANKRHYDYEKILELIKTRGKTP